VAQLCPPAPRCFPSTFMTRRATVELIRTLLHTLEGQSAMPCRDVLQSKCLASSLGVYFYSNGLLIVACWKVLTESLPAHDHIRFCYHSAFFRQCLYSRCLVIVHMSNYYRLRLVYKGAGIAQSV
jgi:hypothetical protein